MVEQKKSIFTQLDPSEPLSHLIVIDSTKMSLAEFLIYCIDSNDERLPKDLKSKKLSTLRRVFLEAGVRALEADISSTKWVQLGLEIEPGRIYGELYSRIANIARKMLQGAEISNFFFMHKPPGLRIRFETNGVDQRRLAEDLHEQLSVWQGEGLVESIVPGVYEPETHLFGGPVSMLWVHELFTIDSLAWLDYHTLAYSEPEVAGSAWALSLVMLRALFKGLGITDWEDIDVWDRVRSKMGRSLPDEVLGLDEFEGIAADIQSRWLTPQLLLDELSPQVQSIAQDYQSLAINIATRWNSEYFATRDAHFGPRTGAALFTIFHWNRAALPLTRQALLAEALVERETF